MLRYCVEKADDKRELELRQSVLRDLFFRGVSASPLLSLECEVAAAAAVWGPGRGSDTEGGRKIKVARRRGSQEMSVEDKDDIGNDKSGCL